MPARKRFSPPTPLVSRRELARRNEAIRAERARSRGVAQGKRARAAQLKGDAFSQTRRLLEQETKTDWRAARGRPERYWDERWDLSATRAKASWEDLHEWRFALLRNRTIVTYLETRTISVLVEVEDGASGRVMTLTASAAGSFDQAMDELEEKFRAWAEKYGRDEDEEGFSRVIEVTFLLRRRDVHPLWKSYVRGQVERREKKSRRRRR